MEGSAEHKAISARRLNNGGILLEMCSNAAAGWVNSPSNRATFLEHFVPDAIVKEQAYSLVVQFVPLHFSPDRDEEL